MPEWLLNDENYHPEKDQDTFIDKSILSLLKLIARMRMTSHSGGGMWSVNTTVNVVGTLLLIVLISLARNVVFLTVVMVYLLVLLSMMSGRELLKILKLSAAMALFTAVILIPAWLSGNSYSFVMMPIKVFETVTAVNLLSRKSSWHALTAAFKRFYLPDLLILVLDITLKYIAMLGAFSLEMLYALKLRSVGRNNSKHAALSGIVGTLFIKSTEMAEDMYAAMACRGFNGEYKVVNKMAFGIADGVYGVLNLGMLAVYVYLGRA